MMYWKLKKLFIFFRSDGYVRLGITEAAGVRLREAGLTERTGTSPEGIQWNIVNVHEPTPLEERYRALAEEPERLIQTLGLDYPVPDDIEDIIVDRYEIIIFITPQAYNRIALVDGIRLRGLSPEGLPWAISYFPESGVEVRDELAIVLTEETLGERFEGNPTDLLSELKEKMGNDSQPNVPPILLRGKDGEGQTHFALITTLHGDEQIVLTIHPEDIEELRFIMPNWRLKADSDEESPDEAMLGQDEVGGIDLNPTILDFKLERDGDGIILPIPQQPILNMNIDGFIPVIINIAPISNLPMILGLTDDQEEQPVADSSQGNILILGLKEDQEEQQLSSL